MSESNYVIKQLISLQTWPRDPLAPAPIALHNCARINFTLLYSAQASNTTLCYKGNWLRHFCPDTVLQRTIIANINGQSRVGQVYLIKFIPTEYRVSCPVKEQCLLSKIFFLVPQLRTRFSVDQITYPPIYYPLCPVLWSLLVWLIWLLLCEPSPCFWFFGC